MINRLWLFISVLLFSATAVSSERWLIATQTELLGVNGQISVEVVKPNFIDPENMRLKS